MVYHLRCLTCRRKVTTSDLAPGKASICLRCVVQVAEANRTRPTPEAGAYMKKWNAERLLGRVRKYGLTMEQYEAMREACQYSCEICGAREQADHDLHIDHCHDTGKVRGLLCQFCNNGLGMFRDDTDRMATAVAYLKRAQGHLN